MTLAARSETEHNMRSTSDRKGGQTHMCNMATEDNNRASAAAEKLMPKAGQMKERTTGLQHDGRATRAE